MKKQVLLAVLILLLVVSLVGCDDGGTPTPPPSVITVTATQNYLAIDSVQFADYDFTKLFVISKDGNLIPTLSEYVDVSQLAPDGAEHTATCTYNGVTASVTVLVYVPQCQITATADEITVSTNQALDYDYMSMFSVRFNGATVTVDQSMVTTNVSNVFGDYFYTVKYYGAEKTLTIHVVNDVQITATAEVVEIRDVDVNSFDYTTLFSITKNGLNVNVKDYFLDLSARTTEGDFSVICNYEHASQTAKVHVILTDYKVNLKTAQITLFVGKVATHDFLQYFEAFTDGVPTQITSAMVSSGVKAEAGVYPFTVTVGRASATLQVVVSSDHVVSVVNSYADLRLPISSITDYDYTKLFSLYVDGEACQVTEDMVNSSALEGAKVGETRQVAFDYTTPDNVTSFHTTANVTLIEHGSASIVARNVETYPNSVPIDLKSLFTVTDEYGANVKITSDMIDGSVDYTVAGTNLITLTYGNERATATVTVKDGVVIVADDVIKVKRGTDVKTYMFEDDFTVIINGIRFWDFPSNFIDVSAVDFNTVGRYNVTVTVPYSTNVVASISAQPQFVNYTKTAVYEVVDNTYTVELKSDLVTVPAGTRYNVFDNIFAVINGKPQSFTENPDYADAISCYAKVLVGIDYTSFETQTISVAVYANGAENDPVVLSYKLIVSSDVVVKSRDVVVLTGSTLYTTDLFTVTEGGQPVAVTQQMVEGKVDTFTPGMYTVTINYKNIVKDASVVVIGNDIVGTYKTKLSTLASGGETDEEGYTDDVVPSRTYGDLVITDKFDVTFDKNRLDVLSLVSQNQLNVAMGKLEYTMHFFDGIVVLNPDNSLRMSFSNTKRPLVYFNSDVWKIDSKITVNYGSKYVIAAETQTYSIDLFHITNLHNGSQKWFALKVRLVEKMNSDTVYQVTWGDATFSDDFEQVAGNQSVLFFNGESYGIVMSSTSSASIDREADDKIFANMNFTGYVDGKKHVLSFNSAENVSITGAVINLNLTQYELSNMRNGGVDHVNHSVLIYQFEGNNKDGKYYSYKFDLDLSTKTFTLLQKDELFGYYVCGNKYVFIDGYGTGEISFNSAYYSDSCAFAYQKLGNEVELTFLNERASFGHGSTATFYVSQLLNVLTGKSADDESIVAMQFVNQHIVDGAIITPGVTQLAKNTDSASAKQTIVNGLTVQTASGVWTNEQKLDKNNINFTTVKFNVAGAYMYTINVNVCGKTVQVQYPIVILGDVYTGNGIVGTYTDGVVQNGATLTITKYGQATLDYFGAVFGGKVTIFDDNTYVIKAKGEMGIVVISGQFVQNGLITATVNGALNFSDCFTSGAVNATGSANLTLRSVTIGGNTVYYCSESSGSLGSSATVELVTGANITESGAIVKITYGTTEKIAQISAWGSSTSGLTLSDAYRGTYTGPMGEVTLDGFGKITGAVQGTYVVNSRNVLLLHTASGYATYKFNATAKTYEVYELALDNSLVEGSSYFAEYKFVCYGSHYTANTTFTFGADGVVTVVSTSDEHDNGNYKCLSDVYSPSFASASGTQGTYSVSGNVITVNVGGETFTFEIADIISRNVLRCVSTTVSANAHGYFETSTSFLVA